MKGTTYSGYTVWPDGLSVWPRRKKTWLWAELTAIESEFTSGHKAIMATLRFRTGKTLSLQTTRAFTFGTGQGRFAELIAQAVAAAPANAAFDELTFEIAQWGPREIRRRLLGRPGQTTDVATLLERARHHRVWLEDDRTERALEAALAQDRNSAEALELRFRFLRERGEVKRMRLAAEEWRERQPNAAAAQAAIWQVRLAADEPAVGEESASWLAQNPGHAEVGAELAVYHFRARNYQKAAEAWRQAADVTLDIRMRRRAEEMARYVERIGQDAGFRNRERLKHWGRQTIVWVGLALAIFLQVGGIYTRCTRKEREQARQQVQEEQRKQWAEESKHRLAAIDRQFTEMTGRVMGKYPEVRARAEKGEAAAQLTVAEMLFDGKDGAPRDPAAAMAYLEESAAQNYRAALLSLGQILLAGNKVEKNPPRAVQLLERAMELGSPRAAAELAELYQAGNGVPEDANKALALYVRAAEGGYLYAMTQAGWMLERGLGVPADRGRALDYYRKAADKNSEWATDRLVQLLWSPEEDDAAREEGWKWMKHGAKNKNINQRVRAAVTVLAGVREDPEVEALAKGWLEEAANKQALARGLLAQCLMNGWGMEQNFARATQLFEASQQEDAYSREQLARNLAFGVGVPRDISRAHVLLESFKGTEKYERLEKYIRVAEAPGEPQATLVAIHRDAPKYPVRLRRANIQGDVLVRFQIREDGFLEKVEVVSATHPEFGRAARLAVAFWRFHPLLQNIGKNCDQRLEFRVEEADGTTGRAGP